MDPEDELDLSHVDAAEAAESQAGLLMMLPLGFAGAEAAQQQKRQSMAAGPDSFELTAHLEQLRKSAPSAEERQVEQARNVAQSIEDRDPKLRRRIEARILRDLRAGARKCSTRENAVTNIFIASRGTMFTRVAGSVHWLEEELRAEQINPMLPLFRYKKVDVPKKDALVIWYIDWNRREVYTQGRLDSLNGVAVSSDFSPLDIISLSRLAASVTRYVAVKGAAKAVRAVRHVGVHARNAATKNFGQIRRATAGRLTRGRGTAASQRTPAQSARQSSAGAQPRSGRGGTSGRARTAPPSARRLPEAVRERVATFYQHFGHKLPRDDGTVKELADLLGKTSKSEIPHLHRRAAAGELKVLVGLLRSPKTEYVRLLKPAQGAGRRTQDFAVKWSGSGTTRVEVRTVTRARVGERTGQRGNLAAGDAPGWTDMNSGKVRDAINAKLQHGQLTGKNSILVIDVPGRTTGPILSSSDLASVRRKIAASGKAREVWVMHSRDGRRVVERIDNQPGSVGFADALPGG